MKTRLTERLALTHPVIQAPMAFAAGGALAAAVSGAGALGLIGGGYGDQDWIGHQFDQAGNTRVGCGFITWALSKQPSLLDRALERAPAAIFLSFGDPAPFADKIRRTGVPLIIQIQTLRDARRAIEVGADVIVAQGAEAGGHGESRGAMALVPEVADEIARSDSGALLCAAGGIADGRGLAAALMLGADGAVIGTRFLAADEALVHPNVRSDLLRASGDETLRTNVPDIVRGYDWPARYSIRVRSNDFIEKWHGREMALGAEIAIERKAWADAQASGDVSVAAGIIGEGVGIVRAAMPADEIVEEIVRDAEALLGRDDVTGLHLAAG